MPFLLLILFVTFAVLFYRSRTTSLTRNCRWRRQGKGLWRCAYCGQVLEGMDEAPKNCINPKR